MSKFQLLSWESQRGHGSKRNTSHNFSVKIPLKMQIFFTFNSSFKAIATRLYFFCAFKQLMFFSSVLFYLYMIGWEIRKIILKLPPFWIPNKELQEGESSNCNKTISVAEKKCNINFNFSVINISKKNSCSIPYHI